VPHGTLQDGFEGVDCILGESGGLHKLLHVG
jgi:hypothetical protein